MVHGSHVQALTSAWLSVGLASGLMAGALGGATTGQAQEATQDSSQEAQAPKPFCCSEKHLPLAAAEIVVLQIVPWYFNRHIADDSTAVITLDTWRVNMGRGFEWDPNDFRTNMFMHPLHSSAFYNAARSNGYNYYESSAFAWAVASSGRPSPRTTVRPSTTG